MNLKKIIRRKELLKTGAIDLKVELPGEPLLYSIKYDINRRYGLNFFRDMGWKSFLRCYFQAQYKKNTPLVVVVTFFVSPPSSVEIQQKFLEKDMVPAVLSWELCDYLISFLELLHRALFTSYRQIVEIKCRKIYSAKPRTVFQFLTWSDYVQLQDYNTVHASTQGKHTNGEESILQSECEGDESNGRIRPVGRGYGELETPDRSSFSRHPFRVSSTPKHSGVHKKTKAGTPTREKT
jgi:hypothetical protein